MNRTGTKSKWNIHKQKLIIDIPINLLNEFDRHWISKGYATRTEILKELIRRYVRSK